MQLLSYNPDGDEFFIGMSLDEFEQAPRKCIIDGYNSNYENTKKFIWKNIKKNYTMRK